MSFIILGGLAALAIIGKCFATKTVSFSTRNFQPADNKPPKDTAPAHNPGRTTLEKMMFDDDGCRTHKETQENNVKKYLKPGYNPWSAENKERTQAINDLVDRNRKRADRELIEEIERERRKPPLLTAEELMSEHRTRLTRMP